jgi:hypothetical protein
MRLFVFAAEDYRADDGINLGPQEVYAYLCRVLYNRRNKFDPLWNSLVVAGIEPPSAAAAAADASSSSHSFLGMVGMIGTHYSDSHVTTGFANHLARPLFRERQSDDMSEEAAAELMYDALRVCYYRDKQSINKFQLAKVRATDPGGGASWYGLGVVVAVDGEPSTWQGVLSAGQAEHQQPPAIKVRAVGLAVCAGWVIRAECWLAFSVFRGAGSVLSAQHQQALAARVRTVCCMILSWAWWC